MARATAVRLRTTELALLQSATKPSKPCPPQPETGGVPPSTATSSPFFSGVETRVVCGTVGFPGPATAWFRLTQSTVEGEDPGRDRRVWWWSVTVQGGASVSWEQDATF